MTWKSEKVLKNIFMKKDYKKVAYKIRISSSFLNSSGVFHMLLQRVWQISYNQIFHVQKIGICIYFHILLNLCCVCFIPKEREHCCLITIWLRIMDFYQMYNLFSATNIPGTAVSFDPVEASIDWWQGRGKWC